MENKEFNLMTDMASSLDDIKNYMKSMEKCMRELRIRMVDKT